MLLTLGGQSYTLKLGTGALIELQEACTTSSTDEKGVVSEDVPSVERIFAEVSRGRLKFVRAFLWAALRKYHGAMTIDAVNDLLDAATEDEVRRMLTVLGYSAQPDPADVQAIGAGGNGNPPPAQTIRPRRKRGTGAGAIASPVASV